MYVIVIIPYYQSATESRREKNEMQIISLAKVA